MKTYKEIFTYDNLYNGYLKCRRSKRYKTEVIEFELEVGKNLKTLEHKLLTKTYLIDEYKKFMIYDPKKWEIQALDFSDRIIQRTFCDNYFMPFLEKHLIYDNGACMKGKGTDFSRKRLRVFLNKYYKEYQTNEGYVLKCDITKYFPNINHIALKEILNKKIKDDEIKEFLLMIIDSYQKDLGRGIPMGNQTSQAFALLYLDKVDRIIKEKFKIKYYTRYMDDFILIHPSKEYLKYCLNEIKMILNDELKLELNPKTSIIKIKEGIDYLGARYILLDRGKTIIKLSQRKKKVITTKVNTHNIDSYLSYLKRYNNFLFSTKLQNIVK